MKLCTILGFLVYASGIRTIAHFNGYLSTFREILYDNEMWESWFRDLTRLRLKSLARERYQIARCRYYMVEFLRDEEDRDRLLTILSRLDSILLKFDEHGYTDNLVRLSYVESKRLEFVVIKCYEEEGLIGTVSDDEVLMERIWDDRVDDDDPFMEIAKENINTFVDFTEDVIAIARMEGIIGYLPGDEKWYL